MLGYYILFKEGIVMDHEEIIRTREPAHTIQCRTCKFRLQAIEVMGQKVERYKYGTCMAFENKPDGVLWNNEKCELYAAE